MKDYAESWLHNVWLLCCDAWILQLGFMGSRALGLSTCGSRPYSLLSVGFPGSSAGNESACNAGDLGSILQLGRSPRERQSNPLRDSCLENPHEQRSLVGCSSWGHKGLDMTEWLSTVYIWDLSSLTRDEPTSLHWKADVTPGPTREVPLNNYFLKTLFFWSSHCFSIKVQNLTWLVVPAPSHPTSSQLQLALCLLSCSPAGQCPP